MKAIARVGTMADIYILSVSYAMARPVALSRTNNTRALGCWRIAMSLARRLVVAPRIARALTVNTWAPATLRLCFITTEKLLLFDMVYAPSLGVVVAVVYATGW